jgi:hypothetical protein
VKGERKCESTAEQLGESKFELELGTVSDQVVERGLATFQDQEEQTVQYAEQAVPRFQQLNPYPDQTARQIMSRWYSIDSKTLTKTTAAGEHLISPFYALFNQNALFETAKSFRYFR